MSNTAAMPVPMHDPAFDAPIPAVVRDRFEAIAIAADEVADLVRVAGETRSEIVRERTHAINALQVAVDAHRATVHPFAVMSDLARVQALAQGDSVIRQCLADVQRLTAEVARRRSAEGPRDAKKNALLSLRENLETYLRKIPAGTRAVPIAIPRPTKAPVSFHTSVEKIRTEIATVAADLARVDSAPVTSRQAKDVARNSVVAMAERGAPRTPFLIERGGELTWPKQIVTIPEANMIFPAVDPMATLAWLFRDEMIAKIEEEIDAVSDDANALTDDQRERQTADLSERKLTLEREEEGLIAAATEAGIEILRRPDADPRAVLGFRLETYA